MSRAKEPLAGEVYLADLEPVAGSEQGGYRPIIIFQAPELRRYTTTFLCVPLTTNLRRARVPGTCRIAKGDGGLPEGSIALCYQLRACDRRRLGKRLGILAPETVERVADTILSALGIAIA